MEDLSGYLTCPSQVENSVDNIFYCHDFSHWLECLKRVLGIILVQRRVDDAGATALKRIPSFAYSMARLRITAFKPPPFVIIETEAFTRRLADLQEPQ